jgi:hypothetical protein
MLTKSWDLYGRRMADGTAGAPALVVDSIS